MLLNSLYGRSPVLMYVYLELVAFPIQNLVDYIGETTRRSCRFGMRVETIRT